MMYFYVCLCEFVLQLHVLSQHACLFIGEVGPNPLMNLFLVESELQIVMR